MRGTFSWLWVLPACPYCGNSHEHYAGPLDRDPYAYLGSSYAARCDTTDRRRLAIEAGSRDLWYVLVPVQQASRSSAAGEYMQDPQQARR